MNIEASKRIRIKIMANISALQNPMTILFVETIEAVIDEMCASIFIIHIPLIQMNVRCINKCF